MPKRLTTEEKQTIKDLYQKGRSIPQIAEEMRRGTTTVHRVLQNLNVEIRSIRKFKDNQEQDIAKEYLSGINAPELAIKYHVDHSTIYDILKRCNVETRSQSLSNRTYNINDNAFESLDTPEAAYWYGFMLGDGHLNKQGMTVTLNSKDENHLKKLAKYVQTDKPVLTYTNPDRATLQLSNTQIRDDLNKHGIPFGHKAYITKYPNIDESLDRHLIRGVIDADGSITINKDGTNHISLLGSNSLVLDITYRIRNKIKGKGTLVPYLESPGCSVYTVGGRKQVYDLLSWLYQPGDIYLERKYKRAQKILKDFDKSTTPVKSILSEADVIQIKALLKHSQLTGKAIAEIYKVHPSTISAIKTGKNHNS